jgi:hypothetical protein
VRATRVCRECRGETHVVVPPTAVVVGVGVAVVSDLPVVPTVVVAAPEPLD